MIVEKIITVRASIDDIWSMQKMLDVETGVDYLYVDISDAKLLRNSFVSRIYRLIDTAIEQAEEARAKHILFA